MQHFHDQPGVHAANACRLAGWAQVLGKTASQALHQDPLATGSLPAAASTLCPAAFAPSGAPVLVTSSPPVQHGSAARGLRLKCPVDATCPLESPTASASPVCSPLSITEVEDGSWMVGSMTCDLGYIDLQARILQPVVSGIFLGQGHICKPGHIGDRMYPARDRAWPRAASSGTQTAASSARFDFTRRLRLAISEGATAMHPWPKLSISR